MDNDRRAKRASHSAPPPTEPTAALHRLQRILLAMGISATVDEGGVPGDTPLLISAGATVSVLGDRYRVTGVDDDGNPRQRVILVTLRLLQEAARLVEAYTAGPAGRRRAATTHNRP